MMVLFDLDMTLVDSSRLAKLWRTDPHVDRIRYLSLVRGFEPSSGISPHQLPALLANAGHQVGIVTSAPRLYAEAVLSALSIPAPVLVTYSDTPHPKPAPAPLWRAIDMLGERRRQDIYYVGDSRDDVAAARAAGIISVGAQWSRGLCFFRAAPDITAHSCDVLAHEPDWNRLRYVGERGTMPFTPHTGSLLYRGPGGAVLASGRLPDETHAHESHSSSLAAMISKIVRNEADDDHVRVVRRMLHLAAPSCDRIVLASAENEALRSLLLRAAPEAEIMDLLPDYVAGRYTLTSPRASQHTRSRTVLLDISCRTGKRLDELRQRLTSHFSDVLPLALGAHDVGDAIVPT